MTDAAMSVVLVTPGRYEAIRETLRHLQSQTARTQLELVIVTSSAARLDADEEDLKVFHRVRVVEMGPTWTSAEARMAGIHQAAASVIAFVEEHSYPHPEWAERLILAHRGSCASAPP